MAKQCGIDVSRSKFNTSKKDSTRGTRSTEQGSDSQSTKPPVQKAVSLYDYDTNGTVTYDRSEFQIRIKSGKSGHNTVADNFLLYVKY